MTCGYRRGDMYYGGPRLFYCIADNSPGITLASLEKKKPSLKQITTFLEIEIH